MFDRDTGDEKFLEKMVEEAEERMKETLLGKKRVMDLRTLLEKMAEGKGTGRGEGERGKSIL